MLKGIEILRSLRDVSSVRNLVKEANIDNNVKLAMFLAQCHHESRGFQDTRENMNYSSAALLKVFPGRFSPTSANEFGRTSHHPANQEMIANIAYALRLGNGDIESGDGWKYRGGGYLQVTGKDKYKQYSERLGVNLLSTPDLIKFESTAINTALLYWKDNHLAALDDNVSQVTRKVNGPAMLHVKERTDLFVEYLKQLEGQDEQLYV